MHLETYVGLLFLFFVNPTSAQVATDIDFTKIPIKWPWIPLPAQVDRLTQVYLHVICADTDTACTNIGCPKGEYLVPGHRKTLLIRCELTYQYNNDETAIVGLNTRSNNWAVTEATPTIC